MLIVSLSTINPWSWGPDDWFVSLSEPTSCFGYGGAIFCHYHWTIKWQLFAFSKDKIDKLKGNSASCYRRPNSMQHVANLQIWGWTWSLRPKQCIHECQDVQAEREVSGCSVRRHSGQTRVTDHNSHLLLLSLENPRCLDIISNTNK